MDITEIITNGEVREIEFSDSKYGVAVTLHARLDWQGKFEAEVRLADDKTYDEFALQTIINVIAEGRDRLRQLHGGVLLK